MAVSEGNQFPVHPLVQVRPVKVVGLSGKADLLGNPGRGKVRGFVHCLGLKGQSQEKGREGCQEKESGMHSFFRFNM